MDVDRRTLLGAGLMAGALLAAARRGQADEAPPAAPPPAPTPRKVLVLGGTGFLGPETVDPAVKRGHTVTLFNRGKTNPGLFPNLEKLKGDRNGDLEALEGRSWDVVIDNSAYVPRHVRSVLEVLHGRVEHYVLVSTVSVYPGFGESTTPVDESTPVSEVEEVPGMKVTGETYGPLKALCEKALTQGLPGKGTIVRPGLIVGPGDPTDRFTYWPVRIARGGDVLCPGDGTSEVQAIDVRDLGAWLVRVLEERTLGTFNAVGWRGRVSFGEFLAAAKVELNTEANLVWVPEAELEAAKVAPWQHMPLFLPAAGNAHVVNRRAIDAGLEFRPLTDTLRDTWAWVGSARRKPAWGEKGTPGLTAAREAEVLAAWRAKSPPK
jgi:2'-hydroxyisoflavone reductase